MCWLGGVLFSTCYGVIEVPTITSVTIDFQKVSTYVLWLVKKFPEQVSPWRKIIFFKEHCAFGEENGSKIKNEVLSE